MIDDGTQYVYGAGVGPLEHITGSGTTYYLPDGLGSTMALINGSGTVTQTYSYDPYGTAAVGTGSGSTEYQFAGQQTDPNGLQYLRARYYDPSTGRFLSQDSFPPALGSPQTNTRYAYAADNPASHRDPTGRNQAEDSTTASCGDYCIGYLFPTEPSVPSVGLACTVSLIGGCLAVVSGAGVVGVGTFLLAGGGAFIAGVGIGMAC